MVKLDSLSKSVVDIIIQLSMNDGLVKLLFNNEKNPFDPNLPPVDKVNIINPNSEKARILPYPFDPEAQTEDCSFIRVYYNDGEFNENETIAESNLLIDIVVAKSLWLINDNNNRSLIRPYEIMGRVVDLLGKRSLNSTIRLKFSGWQHLYVNTKFDAIRLYCNYFTVEA